MAAFGGVSRFQEEHREARGVRWLEEVAGDVRYAARSLARAPAFSLSAVLVLALGIGASTAVFSAIDAVLLTRLPYPADERLVARWVALSGDLTVENRSESRAQTLSGRYRH